MTKSFNSRLQINTSAALTNHLTTPWKLHATNTRFSNGILKCTYSLSLPTKPKTPPVNQSSILSFHYYLGRWRFRFLRVIVNNANRWRKSNPTGKLCTCSWTPARLSSHDPAKLGYAEALMANAYSENCVSLRKLSQRKAP